MRVLKPTPCCGSDPRIVGGISGMGVMRSQGRRLGRSRSSMVGGEWSSWEWATMLLKPDHSTNTPACALNPRCTSCRLQSSNATPTTRDPAALISVSNTVTSMQRIGWSSTQTTPPITPTPQFLTKLLLCVISYSLFIKSVLPNVLMIFTPTTRELLLRASAILSMHCLLSNPTVPVRESMLPMRSNARKIIFVGFKVWSNIPGLLKSCPQLFGCLDGLIGENRLRKLTETVYTKKYMMARVDKG